MFAQRAAMVMIKNLDGLGSQDFGIYVSHDIWVASFLFNWVGMLPHENCMFLDGFILQLAEERMHVYTKEGKKEAYYPYWWNF
jgi:hypothetical protein